MAFTLVISLLYQRRGWRLVRQRMGYLSKMGVRRLDSQNVWVPNRVEHSEGKALYLYPGTRGRILREIGFEN